MNQISLLYNYIKELGEADPYVSTITKNASSELLQDKVTIFPLLNIFISNVTYNSPQTKLFTLEISCFNKRDVNKTYVNDKFYGNDNELDNMNETEACLSRIWLNSYRNFQSNNILAQEAPTLEPVLEGTTALVDGWVMTVNIEVPNTVMNICND